MTSRTVQVTVEPAPGFTRSTEEPAADDTYATLCTAIERALRRLVPLRPEQRIPVRVTYGERSTLGSLPPGADEEGFLRVARSIARELQGSA